MYSKIEGLPRGFMFMYQVKRVCWQSAYRRVRRKGVQQDQTRSRSCGALSIIDSGLSVAVTTIGATNARGEPRLVLHVFNFVCFVSLCLPYCLPVMAVPVHAACSAAILFFDK